MNSWILEFILAIIVSDHVEFMKNECLMPNPDKEAIMNALDKSFKERREWIQKHPTLTIENILHKFPVFKSADWVSKLFFLA